MERLFSRNLKKSVESSTSTIKSSGMYSTTLTEFMEDLSVLKQIRFCKEISLREILENEIKDLKERVSVMQERIEDLEKRLKTFS